MGNDLLPLKVEVFGRFDETGEVSLGLHVLRTPSSKSVGGAAAKEGRKQAIHGGNRVEEGGA